MPYFSTSIYAGFGDGPQGFYTIYRVLFERLRAQEESARNSYRDEEEDEGVDWDRIAVPDVSFGDTRTGLQPLRAFYNYWLNYSTHLSFAWVDEYRLSEVRSRMDMFSVM
jgi:DnaJ family protein A protein 5